MSDTKFKDIWDTLPFPAFVVSAQGAIIQANAQAEQLISTSSKQMSTKTAADLFSENSIVINTLNQAVKDMGSVAQYNVNVSIVGKPIVVCTNRGMFCPVE